MTDELLNRAREWQRRCVHTRYKGQVKEANALISDLLAEVGILTAVLGEERIKLRELANAEPVAWQSSDRPELVVAYQACALPSWRALIPRPSMEGGK